MYFAEGTVTAPAARPYPQGDENLGQHCPKEIQWEPPLQFLINFLVATLQKKERKKETSEMNSFGPKDPNFNV